MTSAALAGFSVEAFERGEVEPDTFDHEAHVYVAWLYLERYELPAALEKFDAALRRLTIQLGVPGKYHATITWFFLLLIAERRSAVTGADWWAFRRQNADLVEQGNLIARYYNRRTLSSERARLTFVLPDRLMETTEPAA